MYSIKIEAGFSSAHNLNCYKGKCEELHGHNWKVEVEVISKELDKAGMVLDFKELKFELNAILEKLDHKYLNKVPYFEKVNPTSENIARYIYDLLNTSIKSKNKNSIKLNSVTVWESDKSNATYYHG